MSNVPQKRQIVLSEPVITGNEWRYVKECLDTGWVSSVGSFVKRFENMVADYVGVKYAVALANGTSALHLSLLAAGVQPGDAVIVPTLTFVACANAVRYCGAEPIFMDCEPKNLTLDVEKLADFLQKKCRLRKDDSIYHTLTRRRIKAVMPVHVFGFPVDMDRLLSVCCKYKIAIIEDATESLGSEYRKKQTGCMGTIGCLSFNGNKIITTGGGGMVVTNNNGLAARIRHLSTQAKKNAFEYDHDAVGYNYRLTNLQAAMGVAQMERLEEWVHIKRKNAALYSKLLAGMNGVRILWEKDGTRSNFWLYVLSVPKKHKKPLLKNLLRQEIEARPLWKPLHTLEIYRSCPTYKIENAKHAFDMCLNIPSSVSLKISEIKRVAGCIKKYFKNEK